jgi:predicted 3-demethylubiquinone-9 3-methyltransferase (glyoxalase superfamily)
MNGIGSRITPHLWFDKEAREAAKLYCSILPDSRVTNITTLHDTPSGDCDVVSFGLSGQPFMAISAGPQFKINPSVSFILNFDPSKDTNARIYLDSAWEKLSAGGQILMPLERYPFSERYGWVQDKFGVSWQLILSNPVGEELPLIILTLMFTEDKCGKAEEAMKFYRSVFKGTKQGMIARYPKGMAPDKPGTIMHADFMIENQWFAAMDSAREHGFTFNEAISLVVSCDTQRELDYYWNKLSAVPESEICGWCKDRYGLSWQIVPSAMGSMMKSGSQEQIDRLTQTVLQMKKLDIADLQRAYEGVETTQHH